MTRILSQSIYPSVMPGFGDDGYQRINEGVRRVYKKVLRPDTIVDMKFVPRSTYWTSHAHLELFNNTEIFKSILEAESEDYDAVFVRCGNDPAVREAREAIARPVVGMTEAALHMACQLGSKVAVVGVDDKSRPFVERVLRLSGLESRAIHRPVCTPPGQEFYQLVQQGPDWFDTPGFLEEKVLPHFEATAKECIADGAEIIITACALYSSLSLIGYNRISGTQVGVLEGMSVAVKQAEMQGELYRSTGLSTSKHLTYRSDLTEELRGQLMADFL